MEMNILVPPTLQPRPPPPVMSSPVPSSKGRDKMTKNYAAFERNSRDLLRRQKSIELGRRSHKRVIIPSRSYSLKSRFSSSVGHLLQDGSGSCRRASCDPRCVNWTENENYVLRDEMTPSHHYHNNNNNNTTAGSKDSCIHEVLALTSHRNSVIDSISGSGNDVRKQRQTSIVLNMPSRQASVRSYTSGRSVSSVSQATSTTPTRTKAISGLTSSTTNLRSTFDEEGLVGRRSRCSSNAFGNPSMSLKDLPSKERRHRKVAVAVIIFSSFLLISAVLCIIISLHRTTQEQLEAWVRKENEHLLKVIQQTSPNVTSSSTTATLLQTDTNVSHNHNNNNLVSSDSNYNSSNRSSGHPLPRTTDVVGEAQDDYSLREDKRGSPTLMNNEDPSLRSTNTETFEQGDQDQ